MKTLWFVLSICVFLSINSFSQEKNGGKISGTAFVDYYYNISRDMNYPLLENNVISGEEDQNGFLLRRFYFTYDHHISKNFSGRFRLEADSKSNTSSDKIGVFVKDAYIKWKDIFKGSDLIVGIQPVPSFAVSEKVWGYRSLDKTILDLRGLVSSRDFGISLRGDIVESGVVQYWIMFANNSANKVENNKHKRYYSQLSFYPTSDLNISLSADLATKPCIPDPNNTNESLSNNSITTSLFVGLSDDKKYSTGIEGIYQINQNDLLSPILLQDVFEDRYEFGVSAFGWYRFHEKVAAVVRYDYFDPVANSDYEGDSRNYFIAGIDYSPVENVSIIPNIQVETYEELSNAYSFDPSVNGRVTLYYNF